MRRGDRLHSLFGRLPGGNCALVTGLILCALLLSACSVLDNERIPTLIPTPAPLLTERPTASDVPTVTLIPTRMPTLSAPLVITANHATTITLSADQLNAALARRFADQPLADFSAAPRATLDGNLIRLNMGITPHIPLPPPATSEAQSVTLAVTLTILDTTSGQVLDIRATDLSVLNGVTTQQVKQAQNLLQSTLEGIAQNAVNGSKFTFSYVAITATTLTLTVLAA